MRSGYNTTTRSGHGAGREERCGLWVITELGLSSTRISSLETRVTNNENGIATNRVSLDSSGSAVCPSGMSERHFRLHLHVTQTGGGSWSWWDELREMQTDLASEGNGEDNTKAAVLDLQGNKEWGLE